MESIRISRHENVALLTGSKGTNGDGGCGGGTVLYVLKMTQVLFPGSVRGFTFIVFLLKEVTELTMSVCECARIMA